MPAHLCPHRVHDKPSTRGLTRPEDVMVYCPVGLQGVVGRVCPAPHQGVCNVRQKDGSPMGKA